VTGNAEWLALQKDFASLPKPARIIASNVGGEAMAQCLRTVCAKWDTQIEFLVAQNEQCGVSNAYEEPSRLGSDRWAALIAAWHVMRRSCLVVNCGTATTIDALSDKGEFLGGLILPGITLMRQSLLRNTAKLADVSGNLQDFPRNTADAIHGGVMRATLGAIQNQYELMNGAGASVCILSGGAAGYIQGYLGMPVERIDNLVLQGLQIIGEANA
jgi:type III pantothenate kinase